MFCHRLVRTTPGDTALTRSGPSSTASARVSPSTALVTLAPSAQPARGRVLAEVAAEVDHADEPEPGRVLTESDTGSSLVTTTTVSPRDGNSLVQIRTTWDGARGIGGFFERMFAPRVMRAIYADELERLNVYALAQPQE